MHYRREQLAMPTRGHWHGRFVGVALFLLAGIGAARIISTYHVFSQTSDEPAHVVTGMEWLERETYTFEPLHPPLARVAVALGPYLSRLGLTAQEDIWKNADIIVAGDSFVESVTTPTAQLTTSLLANLQGNVVANLGQYGYGPLEEMAVSKRYGLPLRPRTVFWMFFEGNDLKYVILYNYVTDERGKPPNP